MHVHRTALALACLVAAGCVSYDRDAANAVASLQSGHSETAVEWSEELADDGGSERLGEVESGRVHLLSGDFAGAERWFRRAIDAAIDRKEKEPVIKVRDVVRTALAATVTDDRSIEYALPPYELNLALEYGILVQLFNGKRDDALVDARLACYVQDKLGSERGADLAKASPSGSSKASGEINRIVSQQDAALNAMIAATRNSWENPVLWWLTGVLLEADGDWEAAGQSYRRAGTTGEGNPFFATDLRRAGTSERTPAAGKAKLVVVFEDGFVPRRASLKVPLLIYTSLSIDIPMYENATAYRPRAVSFAGSKGLSPAAVGADVRALAGRALSEEMLGIVTRNVTRAAVNVGLSVAGQVSGSDAVVATVEIANLIMMLLREADTRSWITLPDAQYVWCDGNLQPGAYELGVSVDGAETRVPVELAADETKLLWLSNAGPTLRTACARISK